MTPDLIANKIWKGIGKAANKIGFPTVVYRPLTAFDPIDDPNIATRTPASFALDANYLATNNYGKAVWRVLVDGTKVRVGDYLVTTLPDGVKTFFIIQRHPDLPIACVLCNSLISVTRAKQLNAAGANDYMGNTKAGETAVMTEWPASLLEGRIGREEVKLPGDVGDPTFRVLLPAFPGLEIKSRDILTEVGISNPPRRFVVISAEISELGWRMTASQAVA